MTQRRTFQLGPSPRLVFRACAGDVNLLRWDKDDVELLSLGKAEAVGAQELGGALQIRSSKPLTVHLPDQSEVELESCSGGLRASGFHSLLVNQHRGDLSIMQVSRVQLATVCGDVQVRETESLDAATLNGHLDLRAGDGEFTVAGVCGDTSVKASTGRFQLRDIHGDVSIRNVDGHVVVDGVNGDLAFGGNVQNGEYSLKASGDVVLDLDGTANARLELEAPLGRISTNLDLSEVQESEHALKGALGAGAAQVAVIAVCGDIMVRAARPGDLQQEAERARERIEVHAQREAERAERIAEKLRRKSQRFEEKAHRRAERAAQRAQERAARLRRWRTRPSPAQASKPQENLEEERLAVLKMLSEGKVSAEQADSLLAELEGS